MLFSDVFTVYTPRNFPGKNGIDKLMKAVSPLAFAFASQGYPISVRRGRKVNPDSNEKSVPKLSLRDL